MCIGVAYNETSMKCWDLNGELTMINGTGTEINYSRDGSKDIEFPYVDGLLHGKMIEYYEDGSKRSETPYVDGIIHGTEFRYYENGMKKEVTPYVDDKRHGTLIWYYQDGSKRLEIAFVNGTKSMARRLSTLRTDRRSMKCPS